MNLVLLLDKIKAQDRSFVGGKGFALAVMAKRGMNVPQAVCIPTEAYDRYVKLTGLRNRIMMEVYRKRFEEMRWEEIWDTALRVRNAFLKTPIPYDLQQEILPPIDSLFSGKPVSVRSSAPGEDSSKTSFAGLHESFVNIIGVEAILEHIRLVWASLWSDRALLYRRELGLDIEKSAMAVVIQEMINGERSGVVFGKSPVEESQAVIEAVYGLNQGLVDGTVHPDRWILNRKTGRILSHSPALRENALRPSDKGVKLETLTTDLKDLPPLTKEEISEAFQLAIEAESAFGGPQDVEWTYKGNTLYALQARPITTPPDSKHDQRPWYLSLHRNFDNLKQLRRMIEEEHIPAMEEEAAKWASLDLNELTDEKLADEIEIRAHHYDDWLEVYRQDCIPFAHGMRLFGQVYNDVMKPNDPFEFTKILIGTGMVSIQRNRALEDLAKRIRKDSQLAKCLRSKEIQNCDPEFLKEFDSLYDQFGGLGWGKARLFQDPRQFLDLLLAMAFQEKEAFKSEETKGLEKDFLSRFEDDQRNFAIELIDLARSSYRLRDDDNIYLGKIEGQMVASLDEGKRRLNDRLKRDMRHLDKNEVINALRKPNFIPRKRPYSAKGPEKKDPKLRARQIVGQPAGPGIAFGKARMILKPEELFRFKSGEILVCDAVDPAMTLVVPLAAGVVERRGGMLIHGAIIAREYGLPCVTGVTDAARWIHTGDSITVDGYLGIVIVGEATLESSDHMNGKSQP